MKGLRMNDLIYIGATIVFFLIALAYVRGCEKLQWGVRDELRNSIGIGGISPAIGLSDLCIAETRKVL